MYYTSPQTVSGYVMPTPVKTIDLTSGFTLGAEGMVVTGISGVTRYGGGSASSMIVRLYNGAHSVSFLAALPGGSVNEPFYIPLTVPARFAGGLSVDLTSTTGSIQVYDFSVHYTPLPL